MRGRTLLLGALLGGCGGLDAEDTATIEGFGYAWKAFNHRLSALAVEPAVDRTEVVVIGGTSTTGVRPDELPDTCDPDACAEFPIADTADVSVSWAVVSSKKTAFVRGTTALEVGADGGSGTVEVALPKGAKGEGTATIAGFSLSTAHELADGPSCYDPRYGWHPRRLAIALGDVAVGDDGKATVPVEASFEAGNSLEDERQCIDEVNDQAVVSLTVDVLVVVGKGAVETSPLSVAVEYPFSDDRIHPEAQEDPAPTELSWSIEDPLVGFRSIDFRFHPDDPEDRGAYLRTLGFSASPDGTANAVATNWSPGTQLSGFDYAFDGEVVAIEHRGTLERGTSTGTFGADLDEAGVPVVQTLEH